MKQLLLLTVFVFVIFSRQAYSQGITLQPMERSVGQVIDDIEAQTVYQFIFNTSDVDLDRKVSLLAENQDIEMVLQQLFSGTETQYEIADRKILLSKREAVAPVGNSNQQRTITGTVRDVEGNPLPGVSIRIKNSRRGVATDFDGNYSLNISSSESTLVISSIGYNSREIVVGDRSYLLITLETSVDELDEVVLVSTGYQEVKKDQLTGAASVVGASELNQRTIASGNFLESLEGQLPGLVYNYRNPNTPEDERLTIRGVATFDGVKSPLIVIDGFPTDIDLNAINPNIIASVSVLRDAAASTIYGARAANGVIVIETLRGEEGKPRFTFRNSVAIQSAPNMGDYHYAKSEEYIAIKKAMALRSTTSRPSGTRIQFDPVTDLVYDMRDGLISEDQLNTTLGEWGKYHNEEQYENLFYRPSLIQNYELGMSGGGANNRYRMSLNYIDYDTDEKFNNRRRLVFNLSDNFKISDRISLDISGIYTYEKNEGRGSIPAYSELLPYRPLVDDMGNSLPNYNYLEGSEEVNNEAMALGLYDRWRYPYADFLSERFTSRKNAFRIQARLNLEVVKGLELQLGGAYEYQNTDEDILYDESNYLVRGLVNKAAQADPATGMAVFTHVPQGDLLKRQDYKIKGYTYRAQLHADYAIGARQQHEISAIAGAELRKVTNGNYLSSFFGYNGQTLNMSPVDLQLLTSRDITSGFPQFSFGAAYINLYQYFGEMFDDNRYRSFYSQATYIYDGKYIATGSIRLDQSNLFGTDPKSRNKPQWSAGASWLLHKEAFMKPLSGWLSEFKLRGAYGLTGNVPTSNSGKFLIFRTGQRFGVSPAMPHNSIVAPQNQSIRWENTKNTNLGADFGFFGHRLSGTFDWYRKRSEMVLGNSEADPTTGWSRYNANTAIIENRGVELSLRSRNITGERFSWSTRLTASYNKNTIEKVFNPTPSSYRNTNFIDANDPVEDYALNSLVSFRYAGLNEDGVPMMINRDGEEQLLTTSSDIFLEDLINSGTTTPKYVMGLGNEFRFGRLSLFAMLMYYGGHVTRVLPPDITASYPLQGAGNYWQAPGDELVTDVPGLSPPFGDPNYSAMSFGRRIHRYADRYVRSADQIRLTDLTLSWDLGRDFLSGLKLFDTQLRFQAQNVWRHTFSGNDIDMDAIDPDTGLRGLHIRPVYTVQLIAKF
ncbi:SusC/RagA family TonB-linked outer membrane protein [Sinomicrobium sp.]